MKQIESMNYCFASDIDQTYLAEFQGFLKEYGVLEEMDQAGFEARAIRNKLTVQHLQTWLSETGNLIGGLNKNPMVSVAKALTNKCDRYEDNIKMSQLVKALDEAPTEKYRDLILEFKPALQHLNTIAQFD